MKSLLTSVFWPAWVWTFRPESRWIFASYVISVSVRDNGRMRRLIDSPWYRERWGHVFKALPDNWGQLKFQNDWAGFRLCTSIGGSVTGEHADVQVCDDPIKPRDVSGTSAITRTLLNNCVEWWNETMSSRLVDFERSARVIVMQRLHVLDLTGAMLQDGGYVHLCLPMEYEPKLSIASPIGFKDPRSFEGELLWPARFSKEAVQQLKKDLGPKAAASQLQQRPVPASGSLFQRQYAQHWQTIPDCASIITSWDCSFKESGNSYVVGQVWGLSDGNYYLLDQVRKRMSFSETLHQILLCLEKWPQAYAHLIEEKANGVAIIDVLNSKIDNVIPVLPIGGKESRAHSVESLWSSHRIFLPPMEKYAWVEHLIQEICEFPGSVNDDQVDAMTQAISWLRKQHQSFSDFEKSMNNTGDIAKWILGDPIRGRIY